MKEFKYVITDPEGIHARPAGELVKAAKEFAANITLTKDGKSGDASVSSVSWVWLSKPARDHSDLRR